VLLVCDQPFVNAETIKGLLRLCERTGKPIVALSYSHTLGVPASFDRSLFDELLALKNDSGPKKIILSNRAQVAEFPFPEGKIDIDTINDWKELKQGGSSGRRRFERAGSFESLFVFLRRPECLDAWV
jgi:molybdenum cofactor cytidylyltransferase